MQVLGPQLVVQFREIMELVAQEPVRGSMSLWVGLENLKPCPLYLQITLPLYFLCVMEM